MVLYQSFLVKINKIVQGVYKTVKKLTKFCVGGGRQGIVCYCNITKMCI